MLKLANHSERRLFTYKSLVGEEFSDTLCDLGCGSKGFTQAALDSKLFNRVWAFEKKEANLETDKIPLDDRSISVVTANAVIEHLIKPQNMFFEVHRILKSGGHFIGSTPNWNRCPFSFWRNPDHSHPHTYQSITSLMKIYGFNIIYLGPHYICRPKWWYKSSLMRNISFGTKSIMFVGEKI